MRPIKYRKAPVEIEAMRLSDRHEENLEVMRWVTSNGGSAWLSMEEAPVRMRIDTLEGAMRAVEGDYVIRGVAGEFYSCKPDIFYRTYTYAPPSGIVKWNEDKPHRCPTCHSTTDSENVARWRAVTCCTCHTRFARWPLLAAFLPEAGIVCDHAEPREEPDVEPV
jgi:hypothetical protein